MSVPDWPNSYGYNMFLFPPNLWIGGIFYEHTHRLMGTLVGFCSILLVLRAWAPAGGARMARILRNTAISCAILTLGSAVANLHQVAVGFGAVALICAAALPFRTREPRRSIRWLAMAILGAVIFQGILGGLRVVMVNLDLAIVHACFAQAFFCLAAASAVMTSRWWVDQIATDGDRSLNVAGLRRAWGWGLTAVCLIYAQLVIGAVMRHEQAGLAIPDFPLNYGHLLPPTNAQELDTANLSRLGDPKLDQRVSLWQVWIHFSHRVGALVVSIGVIGLAVHLLRRHGRVLFLRRAAWMLLGLLVVQLTLGMYTVWWRKPADLASAHVATGALILVCAFIVTLRLWHLKRLKGAVSSSEAASVRSLNVMGSAPGAVG
jgi:cytochrome c oxidase assembly protein subunit 15